jgi:pimeloyl-ACP methyl ester carboxylesterase
VLVVAGELDSVTTPREGERVAAEFPNSELYVARGKGHVAALLNRRGPAATTIRRFLRRHIGG